MYPKIKNKIVKRILISFFLIDYIRLKLKKKHLPELPELSELSENSCFFLI
jgi:hypothetical protein